MSAPEETPAGIPPQVLAEAAQAKDASYWLSVGSDGMARDCQVLKTSGRTSDDTLVCQHLMRLRHSVARDDQGKPAEYFRLFKVDRRTIEELPRTMEKESEGIARVRAVLAAVHAADEIAFARLMAPAPLLISRPAGGTPVGGPLTLLAIDRAFDGCQIVTISPLDKEVIAVETRCAGDQASRLSHFILESGKVKVFYEFMAPLVVGTGP